MGVVFMTAVLSYSKMNESLYWFHVIMSNPSKSFLMTKKRIIDYGLISEMFSLSFSVL